MADKEAKVELAAQLLNLLHTEFRNHDSAEAPRWLSEISKLQGHSTNVRAIIGIIGATGAGKSALINALLQEERILPTNCMRACTAVVTEISYNHSTTPYQADIEFVSKEQWRSELRVLFGDLFDDNHKISSECYKEDTEAGLAFSKLRAVYPGLSKEKLASTSVEELMSHEVATLLDDVKRIEEKDASVFYKQLQVYIDSREKVDLHNKSLKTSSRVLEYWPLIRVVRLYLKSPVLSSGAVLVDLPGVHDSNAARAAVAQNYLKQCSALFIVAPITRAVDDKSAKTLLGQSFKQQLKLDGTFGNITFICSKTDDVQIHEVEDTLDLHEAHQPLVEKLRQLESSLTNGQEEGIALQNSYHEAIDECQQADTELDAVASSSNRTARGEVILAPIFTRSQSKRKRNTVTSSSRKKATPEDLLRHDSDEDASGSDSIDVEELTVNSATSGQVLTEAEMQQKIVELRQRKQTARERIVELNTERKQLEAQMRAAKRERRATEGLLSKMCIAARNDYSRAAIKQDFATGVKEVDQELAAESDPDNFDPTEQLRDYDQVANSLPVFCVSSRAFQRLEGRLKMEKKALGYETVEDTEIPQLQEHARKVAEDLRVAALERFLNKITILNDSLRIWTFGQDQSQSLTYEDLARTEAALKRDLADFTNALFGVSKNIVSAIEGHIETQIRSRFPKAVQKAQDKAMDTVERWGKPVNRDSRTDSGLFWATYRATARRDGYFPKRDVVHDFNQELVKPLVGHLAHNWERVFIRLLPPIFKESLIQCDQIVTIFQAKLIATGTLHGCNETQLHLLDQQTKAHVRFLHDAMLCAESEIGKKQKDVNREFVPNMTKQMLGIYAACSAEYGTGMFARMKAVMEDGVRNSGDKMFKACTDFIDKRLEKMVQNVDDLLQSGVKDFMSWVEQDYLNLSKSRSREVLLKEKMLKEAVLRHLNEYELGNVGHQPPSVAHTSEIKVETKVFNKGLFATQLPVRSTIPSVDPTVLDSAETLHNFLTHANLSTPVKYEDSGSDADDIPFA